MPTSPQKPRSIPHDSQPLPKGRIVTLGASARRRERFLLTSLITVSLAFVVLVGTEAWMFQKGVLVFGKGPTPVAPGELTLTPAPVAIKGVTPPSGIPASSKTASQKQHTQTVAATMAPTPASGKYEDIILPADKSSVADSSMKVETPKPVKPPVAAKIVVPPRTTPPVTIAAIVPAQEPATAKPPASIVAVPPLAVPPVAVPPATPSVVAAIKTQNKPLAVVSADAPKIKPAPLVVAVAPATAPTVPTSSVSAPRVPTPSSVAAAPTLAVPPVAVPPATPSVVAAAKTQNKPLAAASTHAPQIKAAPLVVAAVAPATAPPVPTASVSAASVPTPSVASSAIIPVVSTRFGSALEEAHTDLSKGNFAGALAIYDRILDRDSKNVAALTGKAYALQSTGQYDAAIDLNRQLLKLSPGDQDIRAHISDLEQAQKSH